MQKALLFLATGFLFISTAFAAPASLLPHGFEAAAATLTPTLQLIPKVEREASAAMPYTIDVHYPQIAGDNLSAQAEQFNRLIRDQVNASVQAFKTDVAKNAAQAQSLPEAMRNNSLRIDYDFDLVEPKNAMLIAVRLSTEKMQAGQAHPQHSHYSINYDLTQGKVLTLKDLFQSNSNYLTLISQNISAQLNTKLKTANQFVAKGAAPTVQNYQIWNVQADGILFTFDPAQVAPSVFGTQEVSVPYAALKNSIAPNAVISACVKNSKECVVE